MLGIAGAIPSGAVKWINEGEHGLSSCAILYRLTGLWILGADGFGRSCHPHDPADFRRCLLLLDMVPEFHQRLVDIATISPQWQALVRHWAEIEESLREEMAKGDRAPKTYALIKAALAEAVTK